MINKQRGSLFNIDAVFYQQDRYRHRNVPSLERPRKTSVWIAAIVATSLACPIQDYGTELHTEIKKKGFFSKESVFIVMFAQRAVSGATGSTKNE